MNNNNNNLKNENWRRETEWEPESKNQETDLESRYKGQLSAMCATLSFPPGEAREMKHRRRPTNRSLIRIPNYETVPSAKRFSECNE